MKNKLAGFSISLILVAITISSLTSCTSSRPWGEMTILEDPKVEIKEYVSFNTKLDDVYVFDVKSSGIRAEEDYSNESGGLALSGKGFSNSLYYSGSDGIKNFIFVKEGSETELKLFPSDVFIYKYQFQQQDERYSFSHKLNIYAVIKSDTNKDKVLSSRDNIALYVSNYDGTGLTEISPSIISFELIDKNQFLFTEHDGKTLSFYAYNTETKTRTLIKSVEQEISEKRISMH